VRDRLAIRRMVEVPDEDELVLLARGIQRLPEVEAERDRRNVAAACSSCDPVALGECHHGVDVAIHAMRMALGCPPVESSVCREQRIVIDEDARRLARHGTRDPTGDGELELHDVGLPAPHRLADGCGTRCDRELACPERRAANQLDPAAQRAGDVPRARRFRLARHLLHELQRTLQL
jgi:hypothetical protein